MGYSYKQSSPGLMVVAVLLLATATPLAYGQLLPPNVPLLLNGTLCCTSTGNCLPGSIGIPGVRLSLNCTNILGGVTTVAQTITSANGTFTFLLTNLLNLLGLSSNGLNLGTTVPCRVVASLPLNSTIANSLNATLCPALSTVNGTLIGTASLVKSIADPLLNQLLGPLLGQVLNLIGLLSVGFSVSA